MTPAQPKERPDIAIFPDLNLVIRTPAGREIETETLAARVHASPQTQDGGYHNRPVLDRTALTTSDDR